MNFWARTVFFLSLTKKTHAHTYYILTPLRSPGGTESDWRARGIGFSTRSGLFIKKHQEIFSMFISPFPLIQARLAGKYRWREFPAVITGNYRPGKYSKFWQSGKYWEIWNFRAVWAKILFNISTNLNWQHIFLIAFVYIMQISYKIHDWSMPEDTADDPSRWFSSPFLSFIKSVLTLYF